MISLVEMEDMLNEIVDEFPQELFRELNGGVILIPKAKLHPISRKNDLYILGEYRKDGNMGRYIAIYYESFLRVYGHLGRKDLREKLVHTLKHEFIHHLESLAGERGLEIKDEQYLVNYLKRKEGEETWRRTIFVTSSFLRYNKRS